MKRRQINSLPRYALQTRITAKRYYRTEHRLFALNWLVSLRHCHDMIRKRCHNMHEIAGSRIKPVRHGQSHPVSSVLVAGRRRHYFWRLGAYERGWEQVGSRLDWAAARFRGGTLTYERLAQGMSGDLAYTVWLEKNVARVVGQGERGPVVLRVTHLYRREEGSWKVIHRHANAIIEKIEATAVLQR
jgi:hypothetical protein